MRQIIIFSKCCFSKNGIYFFTLLLTGIGFTGCRPVDMQDQLVREWYVTNFRTPLDNSGGNGPTSIFRFYNGGSYSQFGSGNMYTFGKWRFSKDDTLLYLHPTRGYEILDSYYHIDEMAANGMQVTLYRNRQKRRGSEELTYTLNAGPINAGADDPFKPELHKWRSKPAHAETEKAITARVINYLTFLKNLYRHVIRHHFESISTDWFPQPLRMHYGNGVRMAYTDELYGWYDCFYDSAQAVKGYQVISGPIQDITLKDSVSKFERNLDCIEQLLEKIKN